MHSSDALEMAISQLKAITVTMSEEDLSRCQNEVKKACAYTLIRIEKRLGVER